MTTEIAVSLTKDELVAICAAMIQAPLVGKQHEISKSAFVKLIHAAKAIEAVPVSEPLPA